jgi:hypothetical protein
MKPRYQYKMINWARQLSWSSINHFRVSDVLVSKAAKG